MNRSLLHLAASVVLVPTAVSQNIPAPKVSSGDIPKAEVAADSLPLIATAFGNAKVVHYLWMSVCNSKNIAMGTKESDAVRMEAVRVSVAVRKGAILAPRWPLCLR
jgi:hypothetical protein